MLTTLAAMALLHSPSYIPVNGGGPCNALQQFQPRFEVELVVKPVEYLRNQTVHGLHQKMADKLKEWQDENNQNTFTADGVAYTRNWLVSGASRATTMADINVNFISTPYNVPAREYCPFFKDVKITLTYQTQTTIGEDLRKDECRYELVHEHELKHNEANVKVAQSVAEMLEADLPRIIKDIQGEAAYIKLLDPQMAKMRSELKEAVGMYQEQLLELVEEYDALIDTPEEFRRIANSCSEE